MRKMNEREIRDFISDWSWCTIVSTDGDKPYAIEVTYVTDGQYMYCGSRPGGTMHTCLKKNRNVLLKICDADRTYQTWRAATVRGQAEFITDRDEVFRIIRLIAKIRGREENFFDKVAAFILKNPDGPSLFRLLINDISGVTSH
jgi:nitroimidazol reductase NimA-like FMN-containing flavoprotein (pyridoxamine 5'-phosphate oxidase superfamily)